MFLTKLKSAFYWTCLCWLLASTAQAATRSYQVDIIVFKSQPFSAMPVSSPSQSHLKAVFARLNTSKDYAVVSSESVVTELKTGVNKTIALDNGSMTLRLGYYIDVNLHLDIPPTSIDDQFKANSKQLVYIDRPNEGVLLYFTPIEPNHVA